ncbi:hypothetical protein BSL78_03855 [Apostichopus japonicus]|uniref:Transmembrane protein n=1 Tax=Stichopus japonicus TaxID=307972 RepID=A0A2G8LG46_STIJA|nr:hypothetical protein BSL78_03855 [Apostichopus japonicus]
MPWYFKVTWFLQVIACSSQLATTAFFWVLRSELEYYSINFFTLNVHGVSLALVTFDFLVSANPCRILHSIYIGLFGLMYYLFTYMYHSLGGFNPSGGTYIYEGLLDWEINPMFTALLGIVVVIVGCPPLHIIFFLLYLIKVAFAKCCVCCSFRIPGEGTIS